MLIMDHFNPEIFRIGEGNPWVRYVLSKDISLSPGKLKQYGIGPDWLDRITRAGSRQHYSLEGLEVDTFRSTDAGVAYAVCMEGTWIYHAGDLNWWTWKDEETEGEYRDMTGRFQEEFFAFRLFLSGGDGPAGPTAGRAVLLGNGLLYETCEYGNRDPHALLG